jgi:hypothetical protein
VNIDHQLKGNQENHHHMAYHMENHKVLRGKVMDNREIDREMDNK